MKTLHTIYNNFAKRNLSSLRLLLVMLLTLTASTAWGADYSKNESWSFNTSGNSNWTSVNCGGYCGGWGKNKDASPSVYKTDIQNFIDVDFSKYENVSLTIYVTAGHNSGTNSYTVKLIDKSGSQVSSYTITKTDGMGSGSNSSSAKESSVTFNPTQSFSGYRIDFYPKSYITKTRYVLTYDDKTVSHTVTWTINPTTGGTLSSTSGNSTTVTPNVAYTYGSPAYKVTSGSASVSKSGNTFTATPTANSTIQINMVEKQKHTITWMSNGVQYGEKQIVVDGQAIGILPDTPPACSSKYSTFVGWYTLSSGTETTPSKSPQGVKVTESTIPDDDATYYAVWADGSGTGGENKRVTLDFSTNSWNLPNGNSNKVSSTTEKSYTSGDYTIKLAGDGSNGFYYNSNQLLLGKNGAYIKLPAFSFKVSKIVSVKPSGTVSGKVTWNIFSESTEVSTTLTGCTEECTFAINENYQDIGTIYTIKVTNANNLQIKKLEIYESVSGATGYITTCTTQTSVTLNPNGGEIANSDWTLENGVYKLTTEDESITLPTITRTGYTFGGWATSSGGTKEHNANATITLDGTPITLYAIWTANKYSITYKDQGNVAFSGTHEDGCPTQHTYGIATTLKGATKIGYTFEGWYKDAACTNKVTTLGATDYTGAITLYAQWTEKALTRYRTDCDACIPLDGFASIDGTYHFFPGETITLTVTPPADDVPYTYQWQKLVGSNWTNITDATATTYTKDAATIADAGKYRCVVSSEGYCDKFAEYDVKCLQLYVYYDNKSDVFNAPLKKVDGATATIDVELQNAGYTYYFKITDGCGNWYGFNGNIHSGWCTDVPMDADVYCGLETTKFGTYVFNVNYSDLTKLTVSVLYPSAYQAADKVIYLDNNVLKWTNSNNAEGKNKIYYRIGRSNHNSKHAMTLVPGTANLYKVTTGEYDNFDVWHLANNGCWSDDGNSIYKTNTRDDWAATQATAFETLPVTLAAVTVTPTTLRSVGGDENNNNCDFYNYNITEGMKTWNAEVIEPTNGTITVKYTHHDGTAVNNFTSGTRDLAHTCLLTITATPNVGYSLASLTVNDEPFTSGNIHTLTADAVIKATFTINTHTVTWKPAGGNWDDEASDIVQEYEYGAVIEAPDKPTYDCHEFVEWNPAYTVGMTMPDDNLEFTAVWNKLSYTITFKNYDGTVLQTSTVECGETPSYTGATPTREQDAMYEYEFAGWTPTVAEATGDQTYTATYNQTKCQYTVTWFVDGKQIDSKSVAAGDLATAPEVNPIPCGAVLAGWTDAENGVYKHGTSTLYEDAQPSIEITDNKTFYAVFADRETIIPKLPENIVYWENQKLTKELGITATIGDGNMTSNVTLDDPRDRTYMKTISIAAQITLKDLKLKDYNNINLSFWARGSAKGTFTIVTDVDDNDPIGTVTLTEDERLYIIENIPSDATSITLAYSANSGSLFFGTVKIYENTTADGTFTKLTAENTNGWTGSDWDGYYLITNDQNNLLALDGNAIGEKSYQLVEAHDGIISSPIKTAFLVSYDEDEPGYSIKGIGDELYLGTENKSVSVSKEPVYHQMIGYNQLKDFNNRLLSWNNSGSKFGFYGLIQTSAPQMYKIMSELSNHRTLCTYNIEYTNLEGTTHTNPATYTAANLPLEFTAPTSAREGYTFAGWNPATLSAETRGDQVVEAQWTVNQYTVTWKLNGGQWQGGGIDDIVNNHNYGAEVTKPVDPSRTGYIFTGWSPAEIPTTMPANDLAFTAQWEALPVYTINWRVNGAPADGEPTTSVFEGQYITNLPTTPDVDCNGKEFVGWTTAEIVGETATIPDPLYTELGNFPAVTSNMTFYAVFAKGSGDEQWIETAIGDIEATDEVVIAMQTSDKTYAMFINDDATTTPDAIVVEPSDLTSASGIATGSIWFIEKDGNGKLMIHPKKDIEKNLYCNPSNDNDRVRVGKSHDNHELYKTFEIDGNYLKNSVTLHYIGVNFTHNLWYGYENNSNFPNQTLKFYKKTTVYTSYTNYSTSCVAEEFDITNTDPIYVTSAVGQKIKATDKLVLTTTDMAVGTEISLSAPNITFYKEGIEITQLTTESAEETFELEIAYLPTAENTIEQPTITLDILGHKFTFNNKIFVRSLPENFVIATKVGATWYALPANMNGATNPEGVVIDVDETNMTAIAPNTTVYTLFPVATVNGDFDRYKKYGERLRFAAVNNGNRGLWANDAKSGTTINNDAAITAANSTAGAAYEWKITTTIVDGNWQYTLQTYQSNNQKHLRYWTAASGGAKWGTYASGNDKLYFLPVTTYTDLDLEVMEWGTNSMVIRAGEDLPQNVNITINGTTTLKTLQNINGSDLYKIDNVTLTSDDCGTIIIDNGSNARKIIRKPLLVSGNKSGSEYTTSPGRDICAECDIVILNGGKLIADEAESTGSHVDFANIYVYPGGKLVLNGKSLGVKRQVYLRGGYSWINQTTYDLPEVYVNGDINFNGSGNIIYDYYIQNYKYYQFSLPYQVPLAKVTDEAGVDDFPVWVKHYNGALRAANSNATSWEWYYGDNFEAGIGYIIAAKPRQEDKVANRPLSIIRFPLGNSVISSAEADKSIATTAHGIDAYNEGTITANNVGWNFIGNPFMATWKGDIGHQQLMKSPDAEHWNGSYHWEDNGVKYITVMSPEDGTDYAQYKAANTELKPFFPFYLQETADGGTGTINFATANRIQKAPAMLSVESPREAFVQIEIEAEGIVDQTGMFVGDDYSDDIDFDDLEKMFGSATDKPKVWIMHENKRMAFEAMTESTAAIATPLGYRAPNTGEYILVLNEMASSLDEVEAVYLTDNETGVTDFDLMLSAYEFETTNALYNDTRFSIRVVLKDDSPGLTTDLDYISADSEQPFKFFYQDKLYIMRNGVIYDATGKQVHVINE